MVVSSCLYQIHQWYQFNIISIIPIIIITGSIFISAKGGLYDFPSWKHLWLNHFQKNFAYLYHWFNLYQQGWDREEVTIGHLILHWIWWIPKTLTKFCDRIVTYFAALDSLVQSWSVPSNLGQGREKKEGGGRRKIEFGRIGNWIRSLIYAQRFSMLKSLVCKPNWNILFGNIYMSMTQM